MKKRMTILSMALVFALGLAGCGNSAEAPAAEEAAPAAQEAVQAGESYLVLVMDENNAPIPGAMVQFCSDSGCVVASTDETGIAVFEQGPGQYTVHVLQAPEGYEADDTEYEAPASPGLVTIVLAEAGEQAQETEAEPEWQMMAVGDEIFYESSDLDMNPLRSKAIFSEAKVTMINIWATWCGPCKGELPELAKLAKEFEEQDCQLIGVVMDCNNEETAAVAKQLLADAGADYLNLWGEDYAPEVFPTIGYPTTIFVDREGKILTEPILGAAVDRYRDAMAEALETAGE